MPAVYFSVSMALISIVGSIFSTITLIACLSNIMKELKRTNDLDNSSFVIASVISLVICLALIACCGKIFLIGWKKFKDTAIAEPIAFDDYGEAENMLINKQLLHHETGIQYIVKHDNIFLMGALGFAGATLLFMILRIVLPSQVFWSLGLKPEFFSLPLIFMILIGLTAALRFYSLHSHSQIDSLELDNYHDLTSVNTFVNPKYFQPEIKNALDVVQHENYPNFTYDTGLKKSENTVGGDTGKIHQKMFIETYPKPFQYIKPHFLYLYLIFGTALACFGFILLTTLPPHNISARGVPTIAIGYAWTLMKGVALVFIGGDLMLCVFRVLNSNRFRSVIVCVQIDGDYRDTEDKETTINTDNNDAKTIDYIVYSECDFNVYSGTFTTETNPDDGTRCIIKMTTETDSENVQKIVDSVIESFESGESTVGRKTTSMNAQEETWET